MFNKANKNAKRQKRHIRSRRYIVGTAERPRLNVYRSLSNIYAQVINDETGETIVAASTVEKNFETTAAMSKLPRLWAKPLPRRRWPRA